MTPEDARIVLTTDEISEDDEFNVGPEPPDDDSVLDDPPA